MSKMKEMAAIAKADIKMVAEVITHPFDSERKAHAKEEAAERKEAAKEEFLAKKEEIREKKAETSQSKETHGSRHDSPVAPARDTAAASTTAATIPSTTAGTDKKSESYEETASHDPTKPIFMAGSKADS